MLVDTLKNCLLHFFSFLYWMEKKWNIITSILTSVQPLKQLFTGWNTQHTNIIDSLNFAIKLQFYRINYISIFWQFRIRWIIRTEISIVYMLLSNSNLIRKNLKTFTLLLQNFLTMGGFPLKTFPWDYLLASHNFNS